MKYREEYKQIIKLGFPIVLGQIGVVLVGLADIVMVGRYGIKDLAVASIVNNLFNLPILFSLGFSYGLTPLIGVLCAKKQNFNAGQLLRNSLFMNILMGLLLSVIMLVLWVFIDRLGLPIELLPTIKIYFLLNLISLAFITGFNSFKQFSDGITDTTTPMLIMISGNVLNIIGNYILIYGKLGFDDMGVIGAGISTLASRVIMFLAFFIIIKYRRSYKPYIKGFFCGKIKKSDIIDLNKMGIMVGLQMGLETGLFSISSIFVGWYGSVALAAHQAVISVSTFGFMIYYGVGAAISVLVSHARGMGDWLNLKRKAIAGFHIIISLAICASIAFLLMRNSIGYLFTQDTDVIQTISSLMIILVMYQFGDALQVTFANSLRGLGDVSAMAIISTIGYFIIALPLCYILGIVMNFGIQGIWLGYPIGLTTTGILLYYRFRYLCNKALSKA